MYPKFFAAVLLLCMSVTLKAQEYDFSRDNTESLDTRNVVKLNVTALLAKNISGQYEKLLSKKIGVALGIRFMPSTGIPFKQLVANTVNGDENVTDLITKTKISNFTVTPEVRIYLSRGYGRGFYIAPYYRYARFASSVVPVNYTAFTGVKRSVELSGDFSAHSGGLMLGAQYFFNNRICLDWWILGAHFGGSNGILTGIPKPSLTPTEQSSVRNTLEDTNIALVNKTVTVRSDYVAVNFTGPFGGLRTGLMIGVRF